ncbi:porphobilinogen deaminase [Sabethes cyaneus]|uniref:porphobilinogen deaminase n=1 Tax=Sabethes cyaneus TaxID=53552 RepID=UPI00237E6D92|nr:porphobilinogen deaminase [Sabethes cyaneus]
MTGKETEQKIIRVGSRKSELALIQTKHVISCLQRLNPDVQFEIHTMTTVGDRVLNKSLPKIGEKSLFTKDLEDALRTGGVEFVVHSLKDLPTALPVGMAIGAVLEREDPRDALVLNEKHRGKMLNTLPQGSVIGTSSLRRSAQLARTYTHLTVCDIRGNLNTRLAKLDVENSKFAGIILAQAGLTRMGWHKRIDQTIEPSEILYAVGQGALAVECRSNDEYILEMLSKLCHLDTMCKILAERSFLKTLGGGCSAPVAVCTNLKRKPDSAMLNITGAVWSLDGRTELRADEGCTLKFNDSIQLDVDNGNVLPAKKSRLELDVEDNVVNDSLPRHSPEIVDDNKPSCSKADQRIDLAKYIEAHGDMFKKRSYSSSEEGAVKPNATVEQGQGDAKESVCPSSSFPVGVDFMGDCPYVSIEQKVDETGLQCPITGKFLTEQKPATETGAEKCPFLAHQAKILDYNENLDRKIVAPKLQDSSSSLFCGMVCHKDIPTELFVSAESLGRRLAQELISKGALDVMKCAQNEIHSKIV